MPYQEEGVFYALSWAFYYYFICEILQAPNKVMWSSYFIVCVTRFYKSFFHRPAWEGMYDLSFASWLSISSFWGLILHWCTRLWLVQAHYLWNRPEQLLGELLVSVHWRCVPYLGGHCIAILPTNDACIMYAGKLLFTTVRRGRKEGGPLSLPTFCSIHSVLCRNLMYLLGLGDWDHVKG